MRRKRDRGNRKEKKGKQDKCFLKSQTKDGITEKLRKSERHFMNLQNMHRGSVTPARMTE